MTTITDWLMVVITLIYVIATIAICVANVKSANATREQLTESKRQYEETKRLEIMPYIQFEKTTELSTHNLNLVLNDGDGIWKIYNLVVQMKNIGNGTAKGITYTYNWDNYKHSYYKGLFPIQGLSSSESQVIKFDFSYNPNGINPEVSFFLRYQDLLENTYTQELKIKFEYIKNQALKLTELSTSMPSLENRNSSNACPSLDHNQKSQA